MKQRCGLVSLTSLVTIAFSRFGDKRGTPCSSSSSGCTSFHLRVDELQLQASNPCSTESPSEDRKLVRGPVTSPAPPRRQSTHQSPASRCPPSLSSLLYVFDGFGGNWDSHLPLGNFSNFRITGGCCQFLHPPLAAEKLIFGRFLTSSVPGGEQAVLDEEDEFRSTGQGSNGDDLRSRILRLRLPKRSATNVIENWVREGNPVMSSELRAISRELRKSQRYKHALELSEWMVSQERFELLDSDYATRIDLMTKVFGIDAAERYFESLPLAVKTAETYTALLHSYSAVKMIDKAEELYDRMKESNLSFSAVTYNEIMTLYMSVGKQEKVGSVVQELKDRKVTPDIFTYNLWISSCAANLDIDEARRVLDEMRRSSGCNDDWLRYIRIVGLYLTAGNLFNAESSCAVVEADKSITQRDWITYDFLVILYASLQNKEMIDQIWKSLRMTKQKMTSRNYVCILSSYLVLGHLKEVGEIIDQWKLCADTEFDAFVCGRLLNALYGNGLTEVADTFHILLIERNCDPTNGLEERSS